MNMINFAIDKLIPLKQVNVKNNKIIFERCIHIYKKLRKFYKKWITTHNKSYFNAYVFKIFISQTFYKILNKLSKETTQRK